jgi:hypothetical protein
MKTLFSVLVFLCTSIIAFSQTQSTVTINTTGNRNKQIVVDSKYYTIDNTSATDQQAVVINDLVAGQHSLEVVRTNANNRNGSTKTSFTLRDGYDLTITVSANGSVSSVEKRITGWGNNAGVQLSATAFNKLYTQTKNKTSSTTRATFLETEFNKTNRKMTSKQASQLIQLINSESLRLKLAKQSYARISDPANFSLVTNLLNSPANRTELNNYIALLDDSETGDVVDSPNSSDPMTDTKFRTIYNEVIAEPTASDRTYYLNNFFGRDFNYYTASQAKQFIELVADQQDRLSIAKNAYRGVTDKENYSVVYPLLTSSYNRSELVAYINTYDTNNPRAGMSTASFDKLYQSIYNQNSSTTRYNSINTALATSGNYFTVAQAKKLITLVSNESNRLQLAKASYKVLVDRSNYLQFNDILASSSSRTELNNYVNNYNGSSTTIGTAMSDADFNKLYQSVNNSWTATSKYNVVAEAFKTSSNYFTVYQVKQLLALIGAENDRLVLAKNSYDNMIDQQNYTQLYDVFSSASSRTDLAAFVNGTQNGTGTTVKIAMSDTEFKSLYRGVQLKFGLGAKYSALTEIFNTETNYFTVDQTKQLIQLVSSESNRLELAKSSYNNVTDPSNFSQLYDIFSSQTSKNELQAYVNSNAYNN